MDGSSLLTEDQADLLNAQLAVNQLVGGTHTETGAVFVLKQQTH